MRVIKGSLLGLAFVAAAGPLSAQEAARVGGGAPIRVVSSFGATEGCVVELEVARLPLTEPVPAEYVSLPHRFYLCVTAGTTIVPEGVADFEERLPVETLEAGMHLEVWLTNGGFPTDPPRLRAHRLEVREASGERTSRIR